MINLLPPELKAQIAYAKRNRQLSHYLWLGVTLLVVLATAFTGASFYLAQRIGQTQAASAEKNQTIAQFRDVEAKAKILKRQLDTIAAIEKSQTKFSSLLADLAKVTPQGVAISSIGLTGDDKKPVRISAVADNFNAAASLRDALAASPRISAADIQSLTTVVGGGYQVEISIGFKPGQSK